MIKDIASKHHHICLTSRYIATMTQQYHQKVSEDNHEIPQSHTAYQPGHREEEPQNTNKHKTSGRQLKMNAKLERTLSNA